MAIITKSEMKNLSLDEMKSKISELKMELIKQNALVATGTIPKSPGKMKEIKKVIARLMTSIKTKETQTK
ncbi:MAG: 50S ribosomal protein L29 [Nanoarchaeota archaeon]|nr:50S ribosomal protein L29 [Nanoarchaeota archaeon]